MAWDNPVNICIYTMPRNVDQGLGRKYECTCIYMYIFKYQCRVHRGLLWGVGVHIFIFRLTNRLSQSDYLAQHGLGQPFIVYIYIYIHID